MSEYVTAFAMAAVVSATALFSLYTVWNVSKYGVFSGPYFLIFELHTEIYVVNLRVKSECGKLQNRKNSIFGYFSRSVIYCFLTVDLRCYALIILNVKSYLLGETHTKIGSL